ncbi:neuronal acetylcholine receptor subunit alpha-5-like [Pomacea canaliculata]|uniref:neuronal acetylcholine receptor subunit alpha-5-like n=1 Tax=Pomacea canaliculata TaxID=400727 RepID=UPI000D7327E5|nr:neuronal acetylcholine receptor subunit alpha-5-like [Pomacea canaliculata]
MAVWSDEYLQWNPDQFGNISSVYLSQADVWLPDLVLFNDVNSMKPLRDDNALVVVNNDGTVQWQPGFNANTDCMVDVYRYPFDTQTCSLIFTTWMMTSDHIQVVTETFYTNWSTVNQEYYIASERADPYDETTSYNDYWTQGGNFTLTLKRRVTFHVLSTVLPLLSFSLLTPLAFLVPESGGEKLTLAVSLVLTNQVFLVSLSGSMPTSGDTISLLGDVVHSDTDNVWIPSLDYKRTRLVLTKPKQRKRRWHAFKTTRRERRLLLHQKKHGSNCKEEIRSLPQSFRTSCFYCQHHTFTGPPQHQAPQGGFFRVQSLS